MFSRETVARYLERSYADIGERPTMGPNFLPVIIDRFAREQLWAPAQSRGIVEKELPELLFVCERNAGRSQMAAAFAHQLSYGWVGVRSAGSHPEEPVADPAGRSLEAVHRIRYDIYHRAWDLLETLVPADALIAVHGPAGEQR